MSIESTISQGSEEIANKFMAKLVEKLQRKLIDKGKLATGSLIGQMKYDVKVDSQGRAVGRLFSEDYLRYVDKGRRPGKQPPLKAIKEWTRVKMIPEKYAFPIARKIGREGIKGINIINPTIEEVTVSFIPEYEEELARLVGVTLVNDIFNQTNTKGQIIPKTLR